MNNFTYCAPTKVHFGKGAVDNVGSFVKDWGAKKVLVHYGGGSAVRSGLLARVTSQLDREGIAYVELGGVEPNPKVTLVRKAVELCKAEGVDFIIAVGGGSVIDSSKCTAFAAKNGSFIRSSSHSRACSIQPKLLSRERNSSRLMRVLRSTSIIAVPAGQ